MSETNAETVDAIANLVRQTIAPFEHPRGGKAVVLPSGEIGHLEAIDPILTHTKQKASFNDTASFVAYVNRFKGAETTIFGDYKSSNVRAVIDYHGKESPDYLGHNAYFAPPFSEQWKAWRGIDGNPLSQASFADFIEENLIDVVKPDGAVFLDLVTNLQAKKNVMFNSGIRLSDGSNQLTYQEEVEARGKGNMIVPTEFDLGLPIYFGGVKYKVRCLLRCRIDEGKLVFVIKIHQRLTTEQTAFADITKAIAEGTEIIVLNGAI